MDINFQRYNVHISEAYYFCEPVKNVSRPNAQFQSGHNASPYKYLTVSIFLWKNVHISGAFYFCEPVKNVPKPNAQLCILYCRKINNIKYLCELALDPFMAIFGHSEIEN